MKLVTRAAWGAKPPRNSLTYIASTAGVKIHYEGTAVPESLAEDHSKCAPRVRQIQASHLANRKENYSDVAYNFLVCPHGYVFEGRGLHKKNGANGNPTLNAAHYAVCGLLGNKGLVDPPDAMLEGLRDAIDHCRDNGKAGKEIKGHKDGYATKCPGELLYAWVKKGAPRPSGGDNPPPVDGGSRAARYQVTLSGRKYGYGAQGAHITAVGKALVKKGFGKHFTASPGPIGPDEYTKNYALFQRSLGHAGAAADGVPGASSLQELLGRSAPSPVKPTPPFPGRDKFGPGKRNASIALLGEQLVRKGFGKHYVSGPGPKWTDADRRNVQAFQKAQGWKGGDADGMPGPQTWTRLFS